MISFGKNICCDYDLATGREWLLTNGIGGFACGTISGAATRRYHSILTSAVDPPLGRITVLSKYEETLVIDGQRYELSANRYPNVIEPQGYLNLSSFSIEPFPTWTYSVGGLELVKTLFMVHGSNTAVCEWAIAGGASTTVELQVRPLLSFIDYHHLQHEDPSFNAEYLIEDGRVAIRPYSDKPTLTIAHNANAVDESSYWYRNFEYSVEQERGFDFHEDLFQPFVLRFDLSTTAFAVASTDDAIPADPRTLREAELSRQTEIIAAAGKVGEVQKTLVLAADQFIVERGNGHSIIAGYPWFSDWGRDTMIALPGLTLSTGRPEIGRAILLEFSNHISEGMIPNRFPDEGETADYNTVDATLWYFEAIRAYVESTGDSEFVRELLFDKLVDIIEWHLRGTRYGIRVDTDGLLIAGEAGTQLTWMDAKVGDLVITPRIGKPVEIQALWYNALRIMSDFALDFERDAEYRHFTSMAELCEQSFNAVFWNRGEQCLYDVVDRSERDGSVRPNQIFAAGLTHSMLSRERARLVVDQVESELLTPFGLRSLSPKDSRYCPEYSGSPVKRDSAYHQGTVWAWLIGGFVDAYRRAYPERENRVEEFTSGLREHLSSAGIGQISEIFDAERPYTPRGCFAQAWSVGELLRILSHKDRGADVDS
ncbi:MAG: glycogen debranching enzyme family protein [Chloracidobacterium sp.]|nr:glycogen debranching enzyme family protein [Chloracidobacterium sp.]